MTEYIVYLRVSTERQQASGLGLEAQREATSKFASTCKSEIIAEYIETESGAKNNRPQLAKALAHCRKTKATLLIARLDRLSRSLSFVAQLLDANVEIKCADMPEANRLLLQMLAVFSEHERQMIRARTKAALQAAKARGVELGKNGKVLAERNKREANNFAKTIMPHIEDARANGCLSLRQICNYLNNLNIMTQTQSLWHPTSIKRILDYT